MTANLAYSIRPANLHAHQWEVTLRIAAPAAAVQRLLFPVWTPGSYLVREYARHVSAFRAVGGAGESLDWKKTAKHIWEVQTGQGALIVSYLVYANELTVRTSHLDDSHGFFTGTNVFMLAEGAREQPIELTVGLPAGAGWNVFSPEPPIAADRPHTSLLRDFDHLADTPIEIGPHREAKFEAAGKPHRMVFYGRNNCDAKTLIPDVQAIIETEAKLFGGLPHDGYLFIVHHAPGGYGGLEHLNSTALLAGPDAYTPGDNYTKFLGLVSHEYFHIWNVKRIRPAALTPYDYFNENYTTLLWAFEGFTAYYDDLFLVRSGRIDAARYLKILGESMTTLAQTPGHRVLPLADSSFDAWIKFYRRDENTLNAVSNYYLKGSLAALCLDLLIRRHTRHAKSLDDVMRALWERHGKTGVGVPEDGVEAIAGEVAGTDLTAFFDNAIRGTGDLPCDELLAEAGVELHRRAVKNGGDKGGTPPASNGKNAAFIGVAAGGGADGAKIASVRSGSPAEQAGIYAGDLIVALDGVRVTGDNFAKRAGECVPGRPVEVHLFRNDELRRVTLTPAAAPDEAFWLTANPAATAEQREQFSAWLHQPWPAQS